VRTLYIILYVIAGVCFALAAISIGHPRVNLIALGLLSWVLVPLIIEIRA